MVVETDTDRAGFFSPDDFATAALIGNRLVYGLYDSTPLRVHEVDTEAPAFTAPSDKLSGVGYGDTVTIDGLDYTVRSMQPDAFGITTLVLSEQ